MIAFTQLGEWGRLGNQMYEYAALRGIGAELGFDVAIPPLDQHALGRCFEITAPILTRRDRRRLRHVFTEPRLGWTDRYRTIEDHTDLRGYFQSPRYFPDRSSVQAEFRFRPELDAAADKVLEPWREAGRVVVGVTVRRGDYQLRPEQFLPLSDSDFYDQALARFTDFDPIFLVSSDEPDWCRDRFRRDDVVVVDTISDDAQLAMLTRCDHLVVANSSYAWWAAWLNDSPGLRIASSRWWGDDCEWPDAQRDPLPDTWIQLDPVWPAR